MTQHYHDSDDEEEDQLDSRTQTKPYVCLVFVCQLLCIARWNIARTHAIFKAGIALLYVCVTLYSVGFFSPYWVTGDKHDYAHDAHGNVLSDNGGSISTTFSDNDTHYGLWEECVVVEGESVCTLFSDEIGE